MSQSPGTFWNTGAGADSGIGGGDAEIAKIVAQLRDDLTVEVRTEVANRLLQLSSAEGHPLVRAALLERAARLVADADPGRALVLLREAFRQYPALSSGLRLVALADQDPAFARLNRIGRLVDTLAEIAEPSEKFDLFLLAARTHLGVGHGSAAQAALQGAAALQPDHADIADLLEIAEQQRDSRQEMLTAQRIALAEASDDDRPLMLLGYADLLMTGEEPLGDAAAVLADAVDSGAPLADIAPMWIEVARATGNRLEITKALAVGVRSEDAPQRLQWADELANLPAIDREEPNAAFAALSVLCAELPDDLALRARLDIVTVLRVGGDAELPLEQIRIRTLRDRDRVGEAVVSLALAQHAQRAGDMDKAERHFRRVRTLAPQNAEALDFFENFYRATGDHKRLAAALAQRLPSSEARETVRIAFEIGGLSDGPLASPERAVEAYQRVLSVQPDHVEAAEALDRVLRSLGNWHALRELVDRSARSWSMRARLDASAHGNAIAWLSRLAQLHAAVGPLPDEALSIAANQQILVLAPADADALKSLGAIWTAQQEFKALATVLQNAASAAATPAAQANWAVQAAQIWRDRVGDAGRASACLQLALQADPKRPGLAQELQSVWRVKGDRAQLFVALLAELQGLAGGSLAVDVLQVSVPTADHLRIAELLAELLPITSEDDNEYTDLLNWQLVFGTSQPATAERIAAAAEDVAGQRAAADLIAAVADRATDVQTKVALLGTVAQVWATQLTDLARAGEYAAAILQLQPDSVLAQALRGQSVAASGDVAALRALFDATPDGDKRFADAAIQAGGSAAGAIRAKWLLAAGAALTAEVATASHQAQVLADALQAAEAGGDADLQRQAAQALRIAAQGAKLAGFERLALEALIRVEPAAQTLVYRQNWVDLLVSTEQYEEAASGAADLADDLLSESGSEQMLTAAGSFAHAADRAGQGVAIAYRLQGWAELLAESPSGVDCAVALFSRAVEQWLKRGEDLDAARATVERSLVLAGPRLELHILRERVCNELSDWPGALQATIEQADLQSGEAKVDTLLRAASLCDLSVGDIERCRQLYRQVLDSRPDSAEAWAGWLAALRDTGDSLELAIALDEFLAGAGHSRDSMARAAAERVELAATSGETSLLPLLAPVLNHLEAADTLLDSERAVLAIALGQLDVQAQGLPVAETLLPILRKHKQAADALRCLEIIAENQPAESPRRLELFTALADLTAVSEPTRAWQALRQALENAANRQDLWTRWVAIAPSAGVADDTDDFLTAMLAEDPPLAIDEDTRKHLRELRAGRAATTGDKEAAIAVNAQWHADEPQAQAPYFALEALYEETKQFDELALLLEDRIAARFSDDDTLGAYFRLAQVHQNERLAADDGIQVLARAVQAFPKQEQTWQAWLAALREQGLSAALVDALDLRLVHLLTDSDATQERHEIRSELADLLDQPKQDRARGLQLWLDVLDLDPADDRAAPRAVDAWLTLAQDAVDATLQAAADRLEPVLDVRGDHSQLDAILSVRAQFADGAAKAALLRRQVRVREAGLLDAQAAFESVAQGLLIAGDDEQFHSDLKRLTSGTGDSAPSPLRVGHALMEAALQAPNAQLCRKLRIEAAEFLAKDAQCAELEGELYATMLADDPSDSVALDGMERLSVSAGDDRKRLAVLAARANVAGNPADRLEFLRERARLADQIGDVAIAIAAWQPLQSCGDAATQSEAAAALVTIYEQNGDFAGLAASLLVLRDCIADADDVDGQLALTLRAADALAQDKQLSASVDLLQKAAAEHAVDVGVHVALLELLRANSDATALNAEYERGFSRVHAASPSEQRDAALQWLQSAVASGDSFAWPALQACGQCLESEAVYAAALSGVAMSSDAEIAFAAAACWIALCEKTQRLASELAARFARLQRFAARMDIGAERAAIASRLKSAAIQNSTEPVDAVAAWRNLAAAEPGNDGYWQELQAAFGESRLGEMLEVLFAAADATAELGVKHDLMVRAADVAETLKDIDSATTYLRLALESQASDAAQIRLQNLLRQLGRFDELALDLETQAQLQPDREVELLADAAQAWLQSDERHRGLTLLEQLTAKHPSRIELADLRLTVLKTDGDARFAEAVRQCVADASSANDNVRLTKWLPDLVRICAESHDIAGLFSALCQLLDGDVPHDAGVARDLGDCIALVHSELHELPRASARRAVAWRLATLHQADDAQEWTAARLTELDLLDTVEQRADLWRDLGRHARDHLADSALAIEWLAQSLGLDPADAALRAELCQLAAKGDLARSVLAELLPVLAGGLTPEISAATGAAGFDVGMEFDVEPEFVAPFAQAAADGEPMRLDAALWLESDLQNRGDLANLAARLQKRAPRMVDSEEASAIDAWLQLADIAQHSLNQPQRAAGALDLILQHQPAHETALRLRLQLSQTLGDQAKVVASATALLALVPNDEVAALATELANAYMQLGDMLAALAATVAAKEAAPTDVALLSIRAEILQALKRNAEARTELTQLAVALGDTAGVRARHRAAEIAFADGDWQAAVTLYAHIFAADSQDVAAWESLYAGRHNPTFVALAALEVGPVLHGQKAFQRAVDLQLAALEHWPESEKIPATLALARTLALDVGDAPRALSLVFDLARVSAEPLELLANAAELAREAGASLDYFDAVSDLVRGEELPAEAVVPAVALAADLARDSGDLQRALDLWQMAWTQDPDSADAREAVLSLRRESGDITGLARDLEQSLMLGGDSLRIAVRLELAELKLGALARPREALRHVFDVLGKQPNHAQALAMAEQLTRLPATADQALGLLEPIHRAAHNWTGLVGVLALRCERATSAGQRAELSKQIAELRAQHLGDTAAAVSSYMAALQGDAKVSTLQALERIAQPPGPDGKLGESATLAKAYELVLASQLSVDERFAVLMRAAQLDVALGNSAQAEQRLRALVDMRPQENEAFEALETLLDGAARFEDLIALWQHRLGRLTDPDLLRMGLNRVGGLARALEKSTLAIEAYRELARLEPTDAEPLLTLVELLREQDAPAALAEVLVALGKITQDPVERGEFLCDAGRLYARDLGMADRAAYVYGLAFAADPGRDEAFVFLERHSGHTPMELQQLYDRRSQSLPVGPGRTLILRKLANLRADLNDGAGACQALEQAFADDPNNLVVLDELLKVSEQQHQWQNFVRAAEQKLTLDTRKEVQIATLAQLIRVQLSEFNDIDLAGVHVKTLEQLAPRAAQTRHLQAMLRARSGDPAEAAAGLEQMVKESEDPSTLISLHQQLADLYAGPLNQAAKAIRELQRLVQLDPRRWTARRKLCDLYRTRESYEALAESLRQWLTAMSDTKDRATLQADRIALHVELQVELGETLLVLDEAGDAASVLRDAKIIGGAGAKVNTVLSIALEKIGEIQEALELEEWLIEHYLHKSDMLTRHCWRAGLLAEQLEHHEKAREFYRRAPDARPGDDEATLGSARSWLALGGSDRAMRLFDTVARSATASQLLKADAHVGMGRCRVSRLQIDQARACYERALGLVPGHAGAIEALSEL